jgi:hypothetical protein
MPVIASEVVAEPEEIVTVAGVNVNPGIKPVLSCAEALKETVPAKLFNGATVIVTPGIVPPAATVTVACDGVIVKSGHEPDVTLTINGVVV